MAKTIRSTKVSIVLPQLTPSINPASFSAMRAFLVMLVLALAPSSAFSQAGKDSPSAETEKTIGEKSEKGEQDWRPMAEKWEPARFGGDGEIAEEDPKKNSSDPKKTMENSKLFRLGMGDPLTGIRWTGDFPKENYEMKFQARRTDGFDFFAAVTFPVGDEHCSFVLGGWGGGVVGISSIDGNDASSNETTSYKDFKNDQWYTVKVRVDEKQVLTWIDGAEWANVNRDEHTFDIRIEMDPCLPVGIANFQCESEIRGLQIRTLKNGSATEANATESAGTR